MATTDAQKTKLILGGGVAGAVLLAAVGWLMLIHPKLSDASELNDQADGVRQQNTVLQAKISKLADASKNLTGLTAQLRAAANALPSSDALADFNTQIAGYAAQSRVKITSVTAADPQAFAGGASAPAASADDSASSTAATPPAAASAATASGQIYSIQVTLVSTGSGAAQVKFLHAVQYGARSALVTTCAIAPEASSSVSSFQASTTMTTTMLLFVQPLAPAAQAKLLKQLGENSG